MRKTALFAGMLAFLLAGCGGGGSAGTPDALGPDYGDGAGYSIDTQVSTSTVESGTPVTVTCTITGPSGNVQAATQFTVAPMDGVTVTDATVTFTKPGDYQVTCEAPEIPAVDPTPATVTVSAGRPATVDTAVAPASIAAGTSATATCTGKDAQGNAATGTFQVNVTPADGTVTQAGTADGTFNIEGHTAGAYTVACALVGGAADATPASLTVTAGAVAKVVTTLDADTMAAGASVNGKCKAFDTYGNEVSGVEFKVDFPADVTVTTSSIGFSVTGTKAGAYDLTCKPADGTTPTLEKGTLTIQAGPAVGLTLKLIPAKPVYRMTDQVKVGFDLVDQYGNPVPGGAITTPTVDPAVGVSQISADQFQFDAEGKYTFHACDTTNATLCGDVVAWCDGTAPVLAITYPERGATINGDRMVVVTGTVSESVSQVASLTINGSTITVAADGSFQFPVVPDQGMNLIDATATDTFGNAFRTLRSYQYSPVWTTMDLPDPLASAIPNALKAYLDDKLFWNADTTDQATISAILEMAVANLDLSTLIPNPVTHVSQIGCDYDIFIDSITFDPPAVKIVPDFGALKINIVIPNFKATIRLVKTTTGFNICPGDQSGDATATTVTLNSTVQMSVDPVTHLIAMNASDAVLTLDGFAVHINNWFYNLIVGMLQGTLQTMLQDQVKTLLTDQINKLPATLNNLLAKPFAFTIPALMTGMNAVTLQISLQPQVLNFDPEGGALDLNAAITSDHLIDRNILGTIGRASCLAGTPEAFGFDMANPEKLMLALFDDALNEALYSLWDGRLLNVHLTADALKDKVDLSTYGVENLDATTAALLPPIITSCNPAGTLTVEVGDLYLEATMVLMGEPVNLHTFLFLEIEMQLSLADDPVKGKVISIQIVNPPKLSDMDIVYLDSNYTEDDIRGLIQGALIPVVFQQLEKPITFAIPSFNLKSLLGSGGSMPISLPDKDLVIVPKAIGHDAGYLHVAAGLELHDPVVTPPTTP